MSEKDESTRRRAPDPAHLLGSPQAAQWLILLLAAIALGVLFPLVLAGTAGESARRFASGSIPLMALYLVLGGSLLVCSVRRMQSVARRAGVSPKPRLKPSPETVVAPVEFDAEAAADVLRKARYRHLARGDGWVWGVRHRWSPLGTLLLHAAVLVGIVGAAVAAVPGVNRVEHTRAIVGEEAEMPFGAGPLVIESVSAEETQGALSVLSARAALSGRGIRLRPDTPSLLGLYTSAVLEDYDLSASFSVVPTGTLTPAVSSSHALRLRAADAVDVVVVGSEASGIYRLTLKRDRRGGDRLIAQIERPDKFRDGSWRLVRGGQVMVPGEVVTAGGARIRLDGVGRWASVRVHSSPSSIIIGVALIAAVTGALLRLVLPRAEATIAAHESGSIATVAVDAYRGSRTASAMLAEKLAGRS